MTAFHIYLNYGTWKSSSTNKSATLSIKGQAYTKESPIEENELAHYLSERLSVPAPKTALNEMNGFYAWVLKEDDRIIASVDHVRTFPLFYGQKNSSFYISDDAEWVRQQVNDLELDPIAKAEFQLAGCVTGSNTLFPNVKQLQAGEYLVATHSGNKVKLSLHRYYQFLHKEPVEYHEPGLRNKMHQVTIASIQRLIDYANGRQIVVPLSGGYDSRLIVTVLRKLGYRNVLTFSYGVAGNEESVYSKKVADALDLRWHFVEYSDELWREAWYTEERWQYQKWGSGWSSAPLTQDWLAVRELKKGDFVDENCVFVPGHSGDFVAGSHIPDQAFQASKFTQQDVVDAIFSQHYSLASLKIFNQTRKFWNKMILKRCKLGEISEPWTFVDAFEQWDWQERQAKFICNSVRVYEFYGYDWWMPLWDLEFLNFWEIVPLALRKKRTWHINYVKELFTKESSLLINIGNAEEEMYGSPLKRVLKRMVISVKLIEPYNRLKILLPKKKPLSHLCWEAKYEHLDLKALYRKGYTPTGVLVYDMLLSTDKYLGCDKQDQNYSHTKLPPLNQG